MAKIKSASRPISADTLDGLLGYHLRRATLRVLSLYPEQVAPQGMRPTELAVLAMIHDNPHIRAAQICEWLEIQQPNLVKLLQTFCTHGWICRNEDPADRRASTLQITDTGLRQLQQARLAAQASELPVTDRLTPLQRQQLVTLLQRLYR